MSIEVVRPLEVTLAGAVTIAGMLEQGKELAGVISRPLPGLSQEANAALAAAEAKHGGIYAAATAAVDPLRMQPVTGVAAIQPKPPAGSSAVRSTALPRYIL